MPAASRLLVVEGDAALRDIVVEQFGPSTEFEITICESASEGLEALETDSFDLVLADGGLPDMDGRAFVEALRRDSFRGPIVMLMPPSPDEEVESEPETGASDHVAKPFKFAVLLSRIRAQLRAQAASEEAAVAIGPYTFRPGIKVLIDHAGIPLRLTEKEVAILRYLHRAGQATVSRDVLLQEVWGYSSAVTTHTLETHIYRLRQKIEIDPSAARILVTEPGGYKLMP